MNELFFGVKKKKLHKRKKTVKCNSRVTLPELRKLAKENGISIYSEAKTGVYKTSGNPKPPKKVGCSTLKKRLNDAGLGYLYKVRVSPDNMMKTLEIQEEMPESFEVFSNSFGAKKRRRSPRRRSPKRRSPKRRSPKRRTNKCNKNFTLTALRKLAELYGISIYSNARTGYSKTTGMPKKPKKVGCSTLKKRLNDAGLGDLYKVRSMNKQFANNNNADLFMETLVSPPVSATEEILSQGPKSCKKYEYLYDGDCVFYKNLNEKRCNNHPDELLWNGMNCVLKNPLLPSYDDAVKLPKPCPEGQFLKGNPAKCKKFGDLTQDECKGNYLYWSPSNKCRWAPPPPPPKSKPPGTSVVKGVPISNSEAAARTAGIPIVNATEVKPQKFKYGRKR